MSPPPDTAGEIRASIWREFQVEAEVDAAGLRETGAVRIRPTFAPRGRGFVVEVARSLSVVRARLRPESFAQPLCQLVAGASPERHQQVLDLVGSLRALRVTVQLWIDGVLHDPDDYAAWQKAAKGFELMLETHPTTNWSGEDVGAVEEMAFWGGALANLVLVLLEKEQVDGELEGQKLALEVNRYERSAINRRACVESQGTACRVCGFDFGDTFGQQGRGLVHVHHTEPLSDLDVPRAFDPIRDLVVLCPNCHAMAHRRTPPFTPDELRHMRDGSGRES